MTEEYDDHFDKKYTEYNSVLRTWFVAFGVGVPGALLLNTDTKAIFENEPLASFAVSFLLVGTTLQIGSTLLNKYVAWCNDLILYRKHFGDENTKPVGKRQKQLASLTERIWIDVTVDILTAVLFISSLLLLYVILI